MSVCRDAGLTIPAISTARRSPIDPVHGDDYLAYGHRVIDTAAKVGAVAVSFGFLEALNDAQKKALWFWTAQGPVNPDDKAVWQKAVDRIRELAAHAADLGLEIGLEMYEDTYLGTADSAVRFCTDVDRPNVGINCDLGNLIRLHRPVEHWLVMMRKVAPYAKYWHAKNYYRTEDETTGLVVTRPRTARARRHELPRRHQARAGAQLRQPVPGRALRRRRPERVRPQPRLYPPLPPPLTRCPAPSPRRRPPTTSPT